MIKRAAIALLCVFIVPSYAWADKVLLKNGNTLEGKIIKEDSDALWLEVYWGSGTSKTKISKAKIKSIEQSPVEIPPAVSPRTKASKSRLTTKLSQPVEVVDSPPIAKSGIKKIKIALGVIAGLFFIFLSLPYFIVSKISRVQLIRPVGIKIICLWLSYGTGMALLAGGLAGYLGSHSVINPAIAISVSLLFFIVLMGVFYLRRWARLLLIILLVFGFFETAAEITLKRKIAGEFSKPRTQEDRLEYHSQKAGLPQEIYFSKGAEGAALRKIFAMAEAWRWYVCIVCLAGILYLTRTQVAGAFVRAEQFGLRQIISAKRLSIVIILLACVVVAIYKLYPYGLNRLTQDATFVSFQEKLGWVIKNASAPSRKYK